MYQVVASRRPVQSGRGRRINLTEQELRLLYNNGAGGSVDIHGSQRERDAFVSRARNAAKKLGMRIDTRTETDNTTSGPEKVTVVTWSRESDNQN